MTIHFLDLLFDFHKLVSTTLTYRFLVLILVFMSQIEMKMKEKDEVMLNWNTSYCRYVFEDLK